jgi:serine/threonine-protein kinase RIO1
MPAVTVKLFAQYREGRKVRNSRRSRAMEKGSKFGREQQEKIWQSAEVDALRRLAEAGVRVPKPYDMLEGVLLMELVTDDDGDVAPRLSEVVMSAEQAEEDHALMMQYVVRMLCAGIIHGEPQARMAQRAQHLGEALIIVDHGVFGDFQQDAVQRQFGLLLAHLP